MKVLFCDDDLEMLEKIKNDFRTYFERKISSLEIECTSKIKKEISKYDLCFLDIDLKMKMVFLMLKVKRNQFPIDYHFCFTKRRSRLSNFFSTAFSIHSKKTLSRRYKRSI